MPDYPSATYVSPPNYAALLAPIGDLPTVFRTAQQQQNQLNVENAFKGGVPMNADGTPNYAAILQARAAAGDPNAVGSFGPEAAFQSYLQKGQAPSQYDPGGGGGAALPAGGGALEPGGPPQPQPGAAAPVAPQQPVAHPGPPLMALVQAAAPVASDPGKEGAVTSFLAKAMNPGGPPLNPTVPLTPEQMEKAKRIMQAAGLIPSQPGQLVSPVRWDLLAQGGIRGGVSSAAAPAPAGATGQQPQQGDVITQLKANIANRVESGGDYGALGPIIKTGPLVGDRGYGRYQVMGTNVGTWTQEALGTKLTPEQFLKSSDAQERVADFKMRQLASQGNSPADIASIWFTGKPQAQGANRRDQLGTTGAQYVAEATAGLEGGAAPEGSRALAPQFPLPRSFKQGQETEAIMALQREAAKYAAIPGGAGSAQAARLNQWAQEIAGQITPIRVGSGAYESILDPRTGKPIYESPLLSGAGGSPEEMQGLAENYYQSGKLPPGGGPMGMARQNAIISMAHQLHSDAADWENRPQAWQAFAAKSGGLRQLFQRATGMSLVENEASRLVPRVRDLLPKLDHTQYPDLNRAINAYKERTGDENIVKLRISGTALANVFARAVKGGAAPTVSDTEEAYKNLNLAWSKGQLGAALDQMEKELQSTKASINDTLSEYGMTVQDFGHGGAATGAVAGAGDVGAAGPTDLGEGWTVEVRP